MIKEMFGPNEKLGSDYVLQKLMEVSFLEMFRDDLNVIKKIADISTRKTFKQGSYLIIEGDYGDNLYIVLSGEIEIQKKTLQNETYTVTVLNANVSRISVGEIALLDNDQSSASVYAKTKCDCLVIKRDDFMKFGDENPEIGLKITRSIASQVCSKLRKSNSDVITLFSALVHEISDIED